MNKNDSLILVSFYHSTNGPDWSFDGGWLNGPVSTWFGVTLEQGRVTTLHIEGGELSGTLPASLGRLSQLKKLNLRYNHIGGTIPAALGQLSKLEELNLSENLFSGSIPSSLGKLSRLKQLILGLNQLTGGIPPALSRLANLEALLLWNNQLGGRIPPSLSKLSKLRNLGLNVCRLNGRIPPALGKLDSLRALSLSGNQLHGRIPALLGDLSNLEGLDLSGSGLSGRIPRSLGKLLKLQLLSLSSNDLSGPMPASLGNLTNLVQLQLGGNRLSGRIPTSFGNLASLINLYLGRNLLEGNIPPILGSLPNLGTLDLQLNRLSGRIPDELGTSKIYYLRFGYNQLSGPVPVSLTDPARETGELSLEYNRFNYDGLENIREKVPIATYSPQARVPIIKDGNVLSVNVGGNINNNLYRWFKDGEEVAFNEADSTYTVTESGYYHMSAFNVTVFDLPLRTDSIFVDINTFNKHPFLSKEKKPGKAFFTFYPNPAIQYIYLRIAVEHSGRSLDISITDMNQQVVLQRRISAGTGQSFMPVDISPLSSGVYVLTVKSDTGQWSEKLVKVAAY